MLMCQKRIKPLWPLERRRAALPPLIQYALCSSTWTQNRHLCNKDPGDIAREQTYYWSPSTPVVAGGESHYVCSRFLTLAGMPTFLRHVACEGVRASLEASCRNPLGQQRSWSPRHSSDQAQIQGAKVNTKLLPEG